MAPLLAEQRAALLGLAAGLDPAAWERETRWRARTVREVVAHLVEAELRFGRLYRGEATVLDAEELDPEADIGRWARADGETVRFSLWHHGSATQRVVDSRAEASWRREVVLAGERRMLRDVLRRHLLDLAIHADDVRSALAAPPLWGDRLPALVDCSLEDAPAALAGAPLASVVRLRAEDAGEWALEGALGGRRLADPGTVAAVTWEAPAELVLLALAGRLAPEEALAASRVEGDPAVVEALIRAWRWPC
jgi:hypothetical protein